MLGPAPGLLLPLGDAQGCWWTHLVSGLPCALQPAGRSAWPCSPGGKVSLSEDCKESQQQRRW